MRQNLRDCSKQRDEGSGKTSTGHGAAWVHSRRADTYGRLPEKKRAHRCCLEQTQFKVEAGDASMEVEAAATLLVGILSKRGIEATAKQLVELIKLGQ